MGEDRDEESCLGGRSKRGDDGKKEDVDKDFWTGILEDDDDVLLLLLLLPCLVVSLSVVVNCNDVDVLDGDNTIILLDVSTCACRRLVVRPVLAC